MFFYLDQFWTSEEKSWPVAQREMAEGGRGVRRAEPVAKKLPLPALPPHKILTVNVSVRNQKKGVEIGNNIRQAARHIKNTDQATALVKWQPLSHHKECRC